MVEIFEDLHLVHDVRLLSLDSLLRDDFHGHAPDLVSGRRSVLPLAADHLPEGALAELLKMREAVRARGKSARAAWPRRKPGERGKRRAVRARASLPGRDRKPQAIQDSGEIAHLSELVVLLLDVRRRLHRGERDAKARREGEERKESGVDELRLFAFLLFSTFLKGSDNKPEAKERLEFPFSLT